jgi:hypothetical protein
MAKTKGNTQLSEAIELMKSYKFPMCKADRAELIEKYRNKFECSKETAYYYYFYKAMKSLAAEGIEVAVAKEKAYKKISKEKTVAEVVAGMPSDIQIAMTKRSPFAQLGV